MTEPPDAFDAATGEGSPAGAPAAATRPERAIAGRVASGVLGAGLLVMPPVVTALAGGAGPLVWAAHVLLGGSVALVLAELVRARLGPVSLAGAAGALLGTWAERTVDGVFAVAFTAGQAAIAWFAATALLTAADGVPPAAGADGLPLALGVLAVGVAGALAPLTLPAALLRWRPWAAGALALACAVWFWPADPGPGTALAPSGLSEPGGLWLALAALFFAGVGWESVTAAVPAVGAGPRRTAAGVVLGAACVAVAYLGLAAVQGRGAGAPVAAPARWVLAVATAAVLTSYVLTNVRTAARIAARLRPAGSVRRTPAPWLVLAVGAACCAFAWAGARDGGVPLLLLGPAAAALVGYALGAVAAVRHGGPPLRAAGALLLAVLAGVAVLAVPFLSGA
ncbi:MULTISPECIES: amino acid:polyamine antiporter [Streptomyces]|uniref:Amino acid:polyamine antiporter n=2 Tax=Streptomyces TaxID=1883 RepID=A0ABU4K8F7_9ACTN|nr:amino acid:polyamine antiporter [Streptomyces roseolus]MDX2294037.1 amino acid:polyamine antiporter [Streptomyces roseolus]